MYATFLNHPEHHGFASTSTMGICNIYSFEWSIYPYAYINIFIILIIPMRRSNVWVWRNRKNHIKFKIFANLSHKRRHGWQLNYHQVHPRQLEFRKEEYRTPQKMLPWSHSPDYKPWRASYIPDIHIWAKWLPTKLIEKASLSPVLCSSCGTGKLFEIGHREPAWWSASKWRGPCRRLWAEYITLGSTPTASSTKFITLLTWSVRMD